MTRHTFRTGLTLCLTLAAAGAVTQGCMAIDDADLAELAADEDALIEELVDASDADAAKPDPIFCGGIAGFACPDGMKCMDDPTDSCNPKKGGADCGGVCKGKPQKCNYNQAGQTWVAKDPDTCAVIKYLCADGMIPFSNECGCGCEELPADAEPCNNSVCGAGSYCCNFSCSICAPDDGFCTQQYCG